MVAPPIVRPRAAEGRRTAGLGAAEVAAAIPLVTSGRRPLLWADVQVRDLRYVPPRPLLAKPRLHIQKAAVNPIDVPLREHLHALDEEHPELDDVPVVIRDAELPKPVERTGSAGEL